MRWTAHAARPYDLPDNGAFGADRVHESGASAPLQRSQDDGQAQEASRTSAQGDEP